jgi:hypothetical protein
MLLMTVFTSAKSTLTMPLCVMRSRDALASPGRARRRPCGTPRRSRVLVVEREELLVRDRDERVDVLGEHREADVGAARAALALEEEGLGHHADRERALSRAICAMTGAAPVPVPPPMPAVTKTMSAPSSAPGCAPRPRARLLAHVGVRARAEAARERRARAASWCPRGSPRAPACRCWPTMNSTPSRPLWIIVLSALPPPPPTPTTLMRAVVTSPGHLRCRLSLARNCALEDSPVLVRAKMFRTLP